MKQLIQMFKLCKAAANPEAAVNELLAKNPQMQQIIGLARSMSNGNLESAFYTLAKQKGIDPDEVLNFFNG